MLNLNIFQNVKFINYIKLNLFPILAFTYDQQIEEKERIWYKKLYGEVSIYFVVKFILNKK